MKALLTLAKLLGVLLLCSFFASGCATGPRYSYTPQPDSANVEGFRPKQGPEDGSCGIMITRVDGLVANFEASKPGYNWPFHQEPLFLSPGIHTISLDIAESDVEAVYSGSSSGGIIDVASSSGNQPTITAVFAAKHTYRFTANLAGSYIDLTLWDETSGPSSRSEVQSWSLNSNSEYSETHNPYRKNGNH